MACFIGNDIRLPINCRSQIGYALPQGEPRKLVHRIEPGALDHLPGSKQAYLRWQELEAGEQRKAVPKRAR